MSKLLVIAALVAAAITLGCGRSADRASDDGAPATTELTIEQTARRMLEALRTGDVDTFLAHADARGIYERFPEAMRRTFTFEQFQSALQKAKAKVVAAETNEFKDLSYEILGIEERDGYHVVTFKTQSAPGKKRKTFEAYFRCFDGVWKITGKGLKKIATEE